MNPDMLNWTIVTIKGDGCEVAITPKHIHCFTYLFMQLNEESVLDCLKKTRDSNHCECMCADKLRWKRQEVIVNMLRNMDKDDMEVFILQSLHARKYIDDILYLYGVLYLIADMDDSETTFEIIETITENEGHYLKAMNGYKKMYEIYAVFKSKNNFQPLGVIE